MMLLYSSTGCTKLFDFLGNNNGVVVEHLFAINLHSQIFNKITCFNNIIINYTKFIWLAQVQQLTFAKTGTTTAIFGPFIN